MEWTEEQHGTPAAVNQKGPATFGFQTLED